jgi:hypothetical protein
VPSLPILDKWLRYEVFKCINKQGTKCLKALVSKGSKGEQGTKYLKALVSSGSKGGKVRSI